MFASFRVNIKGFSRSFAAVIAAMCLILLMAVVNVSAESPAIVSLASGSRVRVGDSIIFGKYEQDGNPGSGAEPIEWYVLDVQGNKALLLSKYALLSYQFDNSFSFNNDWETSSIRYTLNKRFLNDAFSSAQRAAILTTTVSNGANQGFSEWYADYRPSSKATQDKIFLLSYAEANKYLGVTCNWYGDVPYNPNAYVNAMPSVAVNNQIVWESYPYVGWFLRSSALEGTVGVVYPGGYAGCVAPSYSAAEAICVRPAMWVDLNKIR